MSVTWLPRTSAMISEIASGVDFAISAKVAKPASAKDGKFMNEIEGLNLERFVSDKSRRFDIFLFESLFAALTHRAITSGEEIEYSISDDVIDNILSDEEFQDACVAGTTNTSNVFKRFDIVEKYLDL